MLSIKLPMNPNERVELFRAKGKDGLDFEMFALKQDNVLRIFDREAMEAAVQAVGPKSIVAQKFQELIALEETQPNGNV